MGSKLILCNSVETPIHSDSEPRGSLHDPSDHDICDQCETSETDLTYCNACDSVFCPRCWDSQLPHRKNRLAPGAIPHERTDHHVARKIKGILESKPSESERETLHRDDEDTGWFGIVREDGELPLFQDYGRYANLMSSTSDSRLHSGQRDGRFPSLVSFVGQTGKWSSLALIFFINQAV